MVRTDMRLASALVALLVAAGSPAAAEEGPSWLGAVGDFVRSGLGPPRTIDDIRREEEAAREAKPVHKPAPEPVKVAAPAPPPPPPAPVAAPAPVVAAPAPAPVEPAPALAEPPAPVIAAPQVQPKPQTQLKPVELKPAEVKPIVAVPAAKPVVPVATRFVPVPAPPPEPLASRIAATATVDQAVKLGGSAEVYTTRIKKPVRN